jgi:hypothetical protein
VAAGGSAGQVLQKLSATSYDTGWLTLPADYITSVSAPLGVTSGNLAVDLSAYLTTSAAASTYYLQTNPAGFITTSALTGYATQSFVTSQGYITSAALAPYLTSATATASFYPLTGNPSGFLTSAPVTSVAGRTGAITLSNTDISGLGSLAVVNDAPSNGSQYARKNAAWDVVISGDRYLTTSTTSNTISNGNKTFTIGTGLSYTPTQNITISYDASNHMHGEVLTYNSGTGVLTVDINHHTGSGTYAAWVVNVGGVTPATSVAWGAITGTLSSQTDLQNALDLKLAATTAASTYYLQTNPDGFIGDAPSDGSTYGRNNGAWTVAGGGGSYLPLAGGALDANASVTASDTSTATDSELAGWGLGVQLTADHTQGTTVEFNGLDTYDGASHMIVNPTGLTFPDASVQTTAYTGGGGGGTWGSITGTLSDQTDLQSALDAKLSLSGGTVTGTLAVQFVSGYYTTLQEGTIYVGDGSTGLVGLGVNSLNFSGGAVYASTGITFPDASVQTTAAAGSGPANWGQITGTLSSQTDLQGALDAKYDASNPSGFVDASYVSGAVTGLIPDAPSDGYNYVRRNGAWRQCTEVYMYDQNSGNSYYVLTV